jgi:hypothetical protein
MPEAAPVRRLISDADRLVRVTYAIETISAFGSWAKWQRQLTMAAFACEAAMRI